MAKLDLFVQERARGAARNDKIAARIKECFSMLLARGDFPTTSKPRGPASETTFSGLVTITFVKLTPDLRHATVFFSTLSNDPTTALSFFKNQENFFKSQLAKKLKLRFVPEISFKVDETLNYFEKIDKILEKI